jgi:GH25 family lysozyme M1 (1,4-beta-N-acetylmuramidase)
VKGYAIDVSHHQAPASLPWDTLYRGAVDLVFVRAQYGSEYEDPACIEHVARARSIGAKVGLYAFFRPGQPWTEQVRAFEATAAAAGYAAGDVVPALDVEEDPFPSPAAVSREWSEPCRLYVEALRTLFGEAIVYVTQRDWHALGSPAWVLERPLWVAHYTAAPNPALPGDDQCVQPALWQHRVGPFQRGGQGGVFPGLPSNPQVDQSRILGPLPLVGGGMWTPAIPTPEEVA